MCYFQNGLAPFMDLMSYALTEISSLLFIFQGATPHSPTPPSTVRASILMETLTHRVTHMNAYQKTPLESELSRHKNPSILYAFYSP